MTTEEDILKAVFRTATADLHAPKVALRPRPAVVLPAADRGRTRTRRPVRILRTGLVAGAGALVAAIVILGLGIGTTTVNHPATAVTPAPPSPLYRLASTIRARQSPVGRYAVQIEQQSEGSTSYLKATIVDSRTGDTWTYQRGAGVPSVLPMAAAFSPTEAELQASDPTDPSELRRALIAQAYADDPDPEALQTANDLAVTRAVGTLWNPLVQPPLRAALVSVIASSPGVATDTRAIDARGRKSIEISYDDAPLGVRWSVYLDPSSGAVLESSERPYKPTADPSLAGHDIYLSQYWTNTSPGSDPLAR